MTFSLFICLLVYWLLVRGTATRLNPWPRACVIGGYIVLHAASWLFMHRAARDQFTAEVAAEHARGLRDVEDDIRYAAADAMEKGKPPPLQNELDRIRRRVRAKPSSSFLSFSPVPFWLVADTYYVIGPRWALGESRGYVFQGNRVRIIYKSMHMIS